jgi:hypothetical protein
MLHPDSHNMFENGSFLRRRRRFKQESTNNHHRHQQGTRQKGHRNSPNLISPNNLPDTRPNGSKLTRSRNQLEKDSTSDDTNCLESPKKVLKKKIFFFIKIFFCRNMPVNIQIQKWNQLKLVNQVIIYQLMLIHHHHP